MIKYNIVMCCDKIFINVAEYVISGQVCMVRNKQEPEVGLKVTGTYNFDTVKDYTYLGTFVTNKVN